MRLDVALLFAAIRMAELELDQAAIHLDGGELSLAQTCMCAAADRLVAHLPDYVMPARVFK